MPDPPHLASLNAAQRAAVTFGIEPGLAAPTPPLLVVAGAGTGKTTTLAHRVAHLVLNGADPARILLLTFTRRAAAEMIARAARICAEALGRDVAGDGGLGWAGTFHGIGARLLRQHAERVGLPPGFSILDRGDAEDLMDLARVEAGLAAGERRFPRKATCLAVYSWCVNADVPIETALAWPFPWCAEWAEPLSELFRAYVAAKQAQALLDYDDLLLWWAEMLADPALAAEIGGRFDHLLVDEYQDTNRLQARILERLKPTGQGLTVVGDDAQAIFGFRAATVRNILDFPRRFEPPARIVTLEESYRSTPPILDLANALLGQAREGHRKRLRSGKLSRQRPWLAVVPDDAGQAAYVCAQVLAAREAGVPLAEQAVLARTASHMAALEVELTRRKIPFVKFGGLRFLEAMHVKDVLALLRWADNPSHRVAGFRVLKLLPGVGPGFARRALDHLAARGFAPAALAELRPPPASATLWPMLVELLAGPAPWPAQVERVRGFYEPLLAELHGPAPGRLLDLDQLQAMAAAHASARAFLDQMGLDAPAAHGDLAAAPHLDEEHLILSTIHSAKGREWRVVHVLNLIDGWIPSDMAAGRPEEIDEERRLLYVAVTRARDELHLIQPLRVWLRPQGTSSDRWVAAARSRFLPAEMLHLLESRSWPPVATSARPAPGPRVDVAAAVRARWG
jgi:DNA helicase-2/ATP-dependent DNA helicase PcrA